MKTLAKFIPKWTKFNQLVNKITGAKINIILNGIERDLDISYTSTDRCVVGEARNWTRQWVRSCDECYKLGFGVYGKLTGGRAKFLDYKKELYEHIKKDHPEDLQ